MKRPFGGKKNTVEEPAVIQVPQALIDGDDATDQAVAIAKKMVLLYVLDIFRKYSDEQHQLTLNDVLEHINNDFGAQCSKKTVTRNIKVLTEYGCKFVTSEINGQYSYYLRDKQFSADEVFTLWEGMMCSKYTSREDIDHILKLMNNYTGTDWSLGRIYYGGIINKHTFPKDKVLGNIKTIATAFNELKQLRFTIDTVSENNEIVHLSDARITVTPHAVVNIDNEYYLAASLLDSSVMTCYKIAMISDPEIVDAPQARLKSIVGYERGFDPKYFASQFIEGYGGSVGDFIVKLKKEKMENAYEIFGDEMTVTEVNEDYCVLDIVSNYDKVLKWAFETAKYSEVIKPDVLRFELKEYFDEMCWKYR